MENGKWKMKCGGCGGRRRRRLSHAHSFSLFAIRHSSPAFSLAELMIATVILGVGLLIVAGMFPVAWMKAREQVEETSLANAASAAETLLRAKFHAARYNPAEEAKRKAAGDPDKANWFDPPSFLGDLRPYLEASGSMGSDNRVHPVNVNNMLVDPVGYYTASRSLGEPPTDPKKMPTDATKAEPFAPEESHRIDYDTRFTSLLGLLTPPDAPRVPGAHARFEERLVPPMPLWPAALDSSFDPTADNSKEIVDHWRAMLRTRRYCWAVLARMNNGCATRVYLNPDPTLVEGKVTYVTRQSWDYARDFTLYYVTLRRTQETQRFAQQAFEKAGTPGRSGTDWPPVIPDGSFATPRALPPSRDNVFPVPWRVQVFVPSPIDATDSTAVRGIPAEVEVNSSNVPTGPIVTGMLPRGAFLIDELNGNVYKVMRRRLYNNDQNAVLTLDKEITWQELMQAGSNYSPILDPAIAYRERLRTVWVFPPSVEVAGRNANQPSNSLVFEGTQPVVGIEVRPMVLTP
jgi:type II secretory pathway pseudopilin PulG